MERSVRIGELRGDAIRCFSGTKLAYVTDVACALENVRRIVELAEGADRLFIEAAFLDAEAGHAARAAPDGPLGASSFPPRSGWIAAAGLKS